MIPVSIEYSTSVHSPRDEAHQEENISPRIMFLEHSNRHIELQLEVSPLHDARIVSLPEENMSPISLPPSPRIIGETVGDCCICYDALPTRTNHIFTVCGHLFCVKCLFNWNYSSSTCPMCRKSLYENGFVPDGGVFIMDNEDNEDNDNNDEDDEDDTNDFVDHGVGDMLDRYIYDDDGIYWTTYADSDDEVISISQREIDQIRQVRGLVLSIIRRRNYLDSLSGVSSQIRFTGEIIHTFIPRVDYIEMNDNGIGSDHLYEFVLCHNTCYDGDEMNFFGHVVEITVNDVQNTHFQENSNWENTRENCFVVDVFNPYWAGSYNEETAVIVFERMRFRFSNVRRVYSVWGVSVS